MSKIKCIIVDDEPIAREGINKYASKIDYLHVEGIFKNAIEANKHLLENKIDLLFLDIEMPMINGIDLMHGLSNSPHVIFTTAYSEYAIESFNFNVVDYLLKPISFHRFLKASNKAQSIISSSAVVEDFIYLKANNQLIKINFSEIIYIESMQNYVRVHTDSQVVTSLISLKNLMKSIPKTLFVQTHKSYVVSKNKVTHISGNFIYIEDFKIPISVRMRKEVIAILTSGKLF